MPKFKKEFPFEDCPECGSSLEFETECDPKNDDGLNIWVMDGDDVFCAECGFKSALSVDSETGEIWVQ